MQAEEILLNTLKSLLQEGFDLFKWHLPMQHMDNYEPIDPCDLQHATRPQTVTLLINNYGEEVAVKVTVQVLRKMSNRNAAEKLEKKYAESKTGTPAAPAAPAAPVAASAAPSTMMANQGSAAVATSMTACTIGTVNLTVNK